MIVANNLKKTYGERTVLDAEQLCVKKGETVVIVGPNGSGKSTLLKILAGVLEKSSGSFSIDGEVYYLPQQNTAFSKTVKKNILFAMKENSEKDKRCDNVLELLSLSHLRDKNAKVLSGGECQRLALGRIIVNNADFVLLDEPSSAADIEGTEIIEKALRNYKEETGCGILMTTHSPKQARNLADRIIMLYDGKIVEEGRPEELILSPKTEWGKKFIDMWRIDL